jgi:hypothetical protein
MPCELIRRVTDPFLNVIGWGKLGQENALICLVKVVYPAAKAN